MTNVKFTGVNIAAALLVLGYFFPWFSAMGNISMSGFSITSTGVSPGMLSMLVKGTDRLLMILIIVVPLSAALILYQNISGNLKFAKFYRLAHNIPAIVLLGGLLMLYFKLQPDEPSNNYGFGAVSRSMRDLSPGLFDVMGFGIYLSVAAAVYLLLVNIGKVKDKEYYKPAATSSPAPPMAPIKNEDNTDGKA